MTAQPSPATATPGHDTGRHEVRRADLPLSCPTPEMRLWNSHPRVYLPIEDAPGGDVQCPYCGSHFVLAD